MAGGAFVREVLRDYERDADAAARAIAAKLDELNKREPRLAAIDAELAETSLNAARLILGGGGDGAALKAKSAALAAEKAALLKRLNVKDGWEAAAYKCPACKDTGFDGDERCKCFARRLTDKFIKAGNLETAISKENFDSFDISLYSDEPDAKAGVSPKAAIQKNWQVCLNFVKQFGERFENLLFYGDTGLGKTFLCNAIAKEILEQGRSVVYVTSPQLCKSFEELRFGRETERAALLLELAADCDLLIVDDLGTEVPTVVTSSELFSLINDRQLKRLPTVVSANLSLNALQETYSERLTSRLIGNYTILRFLGSDIRVKKKYGR